jgi:proteasome accessory factor A
LGKQQFFYENGGLISYEVLPYAPDGGLVEGATPECRGPSQALLYQRAQDHLLTAALSGAEQELRDQGFVGSLGLIKNCRDAGDHIYGAQENYDVELASGAALATWRATLVALLPAVVVTSILTWALVLVTVAGLILSFLAMGLLGAVWPRVRRSRLHQALFADSVRMERMLGRITYWLERALWEPVIRPFLWVARRVAFRRVRRDLLSFLLTRPLFTGAGTLNRDGSFGLAEKAPAMRLIERRSLAPTDRAVFELGNLCKDLVEIMTLRVRSYRRLFRRRQRMQLGLSDSNMAQVAEYLKVAVTGLVIDMSEAGYLDDMPRLCEPLAALRAIVADPTLSARVEVRGRPPMRALDIQRAYLERAKRYVQNTATPSLEASEVIKRWDEVLTVLDSDPDELIGCIDWVTKQHLIEQAGAGAPHEARKKIDLKYHELGAGYYAWLESRDLVLRLVTGDEIERAWREPPEASPAQIRSMVIRNLGRRNERVRVSWQEVRIGGPLTGRVIRLDDYRDK